MATTVVTTDRVGTGTQVTLTNGNDLYLGRNTTVARTDGSTFLEVTISARFSNHQIDIYGDVISTGSAIDVGNENAATSGNSVYVSEDSVVRSFSGSAVQIASASSFLTNDGTLRAKNATVVIGSQTGGTISRFENNGTVISDTTAFLRSAQSLDSMLLVNNGLIRGETASYNTNLSNSFDTIINNGRMIGDILLGDGKDRYDGKNGTIKGTVFGGNGNDTLIGGAGNDLFDGGAGADFLVGGGGDDFLEGAGDDDDLEGGDGDDFLIGGDGNDSILGGNGNDSIFADAGDDTVDGGAGNDTINGAAGSDTIRGGSGIDVINGNDGKDFLFGDSGNDIIDGGSSNDELHGGSGNDVLNGGTARDLLNGGTGADTLIGDSGADKFVYLTLADSTVATKGRDLILDFSRSQGDLIDLSAIDANSGANGNQRFVFIGGATFSETAGELRFSSSGGRTSVFADVDGDGKSDFAISLEQTITLLASDFIL